jgi:hypothetical protein
MSLRFKVFGIGGIALFTLLACSGSEPNTSTGVGGGGSGGMPSAGASASGSNSGGASGSGSAMGGSASGAPASGSGGMPGGGGAGGAGNGGGGSSGSGGEGSKTTFFVTSDTSKTGNLGGLAGADMRCNMLAQAAGIGDHTFAAYLSSSAGPAKERIGSGPWYNSKGMLVAQDVEALHALPMGNPDLFIDENGMKINGRWEGSPTPNEHDILTGSNADGTSSGKTCMDWTSAAADQSKTVGHSDGLGPENRISWNSAHESEGCDDTAPGGGAGRLYCFATD